MKFKNYIETESGIKDTSTSPGTAGQLLSSTVAGTSWIDQDTIHSGSSEVIDIQIKNISSADGGINLSKGDPVYIYGSVGASARLYVDLADADSTTTNNLGDSKMPCVGLLDQDLSPNGEGTATVVGKLRNLITNPIDGDVPNENDTVYVKSGGGLTLTKPTGSTNLIQNVGQVGRVSTSADGNIVVAALLRSNDVPNLPEGRIWIGDGNTIVSDTVYVDEPNNRVGIGTTSPSSKLEVGGEIDAAGGDGYRIEGKPWAAESSNNLKLGDWDGEGFTTTIYDDTSAPVVIVKQGSVGIGTTSPSTNLEVSSTGVNGVDISQSASNASQSGRLFFTTNTASEGFALFNSNGTFQVNSGGIPNNTSGTNRISIIGSSGYVGIGTTSPNSKLQVDGEIDADGADGYRINGKPWAAESSNNLKLGDWDGEGFSTSIYDDNSNPTVIVKDYGAMINCSSLVSSYGANASLAVGTGAGADAAVITLANSDTTGSAGDATGIIQFAIKDDNIGVLGYTSASIQGSISQAPGSGNGGGGILDFLTAPSITGSSPQIRMRIKDSGNVGIGTTNPGSILHLEASTPILKVLSNQYYGNSAINMGNGQSEAGFITCFNNPGISSLELRYDNGSFGDAAIRVGQRNLEFRIDSGTAMYINSSKNVGIGTSGPQSKLQVNGGVQLANDTASPSAAKAGTFRYRTSGNNSYVDMCMQTGASTYAWVNIVTNSW